MNPENLNVLRQALPYINKFKNKTFVVKIGGEIADDEATLHSFCEEVALLAQVGIHVVMVHGEQPEALRAHAIRSFTIGDAMVLLATDTAAEGLNLHARCRLVIHAEVPASSRVFEQRTGRLDRYGQSRRVHAIVMASHTREDLAALGRLRNRERRDEQWMADAGVLPCRRALVAARRLAFARAGHPALRVRFQRRAYQGRADDAA